LSGKQKNAFDGQAFCSEGLGAFLIGRLVRGRFFHLARAQEAIHSQKTGEVPRVCLEMRGVAPSGLEKNLLTSQDFHVAGLLPGPSQGTSKQDGGQGSGGLCEAPAVVFGAPYIPFSAAFDMILLHALAPLGEGGALQDWVRLLLGCLKPGGRFYFNTFGSYSLFECQGKTEVADTAEMGLRLASHLTPYTTWFPEPAAARVFEEWHSVPFSWVAGADASTAPHAASLQRDKPAKGTLQGTPQWTLQVVMGYYQKPYDLSEEE
jgi:hypothetical protein